MLPLRLARQPLLLLPVLQPHNLHIACQTSALNHVASQFLLFKIATLISCIILTLNHRNAFVYISPALYYMSGWRQE
ncbi:hypothetical protein DFH09DRAFT_1182552 [Mycena vulgaris]|nr:hypothetical protein DFH09DRAFT_1182552 [Mycena vulgaris]